MAKKKTPASPPKPAAASTSTVTATTASPKAAPVKTPAAKIPKVTVDERDDGVKLLLGLLDIGKDKLAVEVKSGHGTPTALLPSGAQVTGSMTIGKYLINLSTTHPTLLGLTDVDRAAVEQEIDVATSLSRSLVPEASPASDKDRERAENVLKELDERLKGRTFVATGYLTSADLFLYAGLYVTVATMAMGRRVRFANVTRYFDLIQNLVAGFGKKVHLDMVTIDLDVADELIVPGDAKKDTAAGAPGKVNKGKPAAGKADKKKEKEEVKGEEKKEKEQKKKVEKEASVEKKVVEKEVKAVEAAPEAAIGDLPPGEPERLDLRVGKVLSVQRHAQADTLYVEEIDVGEDKPRTVVSGLVKYMKESDLLNRSVVLLCNLKPQKMRGIESQAMVLASTSVDGTTVELLDAPKGSAPGDRCWFDTHVGTDFSQLNPKKKVWEGVQPRLKTDSAKRAVYVVNEGGFKTVNVLRTAKGDVTVKTIVGGSIK